MDWTRRMSQFWQKLNPNQKLLFGTLAVAFIVVVFSIAAWTSRPHFAVLFANLDPGDGSSIVDQLRSRKIPYKVEDGGRTVMVPEPKVYETRLLLAGNGLPGSGSGYEILDSNKLGWTDFVQKLQYRRALEGEIARSIQTLEEVQSARIHLVQPEPSLFVEKEKPATASVVLRLKSGARLSPAHVQGIIHLVSSAVEGLQPDNVTLIDTHGNLLSSPQSDAALGATADQISIQRNVEEQLTNKVQSLLEAVLGPGKSVVRIAAEMDFRVAERTVESYDSENPVVRSEETRNETSADGGKSESSTTNYEISRTMETMKVPSGTIKRLTASVFVDGTYRLLPKGQKEYAARTPEEMQKFDGIIKDALGYDQTRGDRLTVENVAFDTSILDQEKKEMEQSDRMRLITQVGSRVLTGAVLLVLLLALLKAAKKMRLSEGMRGPTGRSLDLIVGDTAPAIPEKVENARSVQIQKRIQELSRTSPESLGRLLRAWLREEEA
jgi:flagellar M-ring protein FliF